MNDPAQIFDHPDHHPAQIDTGGLEDLFLTPISEQGQSEHREHPAHWTLQEASNNLGISIATVRRKLAKAELSGYKVQGQNGPECRIIHPAQIGEHPAQIGEHPAHHDPAKDVIMIEAEVDAEHAPGTEQLTRELLAKLEVLTYRNGYLEAQLAERQKELELHQEQIKLLTDSQHKPSWWRKFATWFMGGR